MRHKPYSFSGAGDIAVTYPVLCPEEAAALVNNGDLVGVSGFAEVGSPKAVPAALAKRARQYHEKGQPFGIRVLSGASTGPTVDEVLAREEALIWRCPYQADPLLRKQINAGAVEYTDMHLSPVAQFLTRGFFGPMQWAVIEATALTPEGVLATSTSPGIIPSLLLAAEKIIVEINAAQHPRLHEMTDIYRIADENRSPVAITAPLDKVGTPCAQVDPQKIAAVVYTNTGDHLKGFSAPDATSQTIAGHLAEFILAERASGRLPDTLPPLQAGVGNIGNAVMAGFASHKQFPAFSMYTEVLQDSLIDLLLEGKLTAVSTAALATTQQVQQTVFDQMDFFTSKILLRPQELSNHPEVIRRLGVIAMNIPVEMDIYGNVNSTHIAGSTMLNGIGGSADFSQNARLSIFMAPSVRKNGAISTLVPLCSHVDHNEHSVHIIVTEQGVADLRGLGPKKRARCIIDNCAHPMYKEYLHEYLRSADTAHCPHNLDRAFELHQNLAATGSMLG